MKKVLFVSFALLLAFCLVSTDITKAATKEPIKIGGIYPLTGYLAWLGEYYKNGAELRIDMINKSGGINGRTLALVSYDSQSSPEKGVRAAKRLISKDRVVAITGTATGPISAAVSSLANKSKILLIATSGYGVKPEKEPFTFNTAHPVYFAIARPFSYFKRTGLTRIGLLLPIGYLAELGMANSQKAAEKYGLKIVGVEKFDVKALDVTPQLAKLRALKPQVIYAFATGQPAALVAKNMGQLKFDVPLLVSHGNASPGFLKLTKGLGVQIIVPSGKIMAWDSVSDSDPSKPVLKEFNKSHTEKYGESANYFSALLADSVSLIAEGIRLSGSIEPNEIRDSIEGIKRFIGLGGVYNMSPTDHYGTSVEDLVLFTIKDNEWYLIK